METLIIFAVWAFLMGGVGYLLGNMRGRPVAGVVWALILGPIGWLVILIVTTATNRATQCPHCGGVLPLQQPKCNHCGNAVTWLRDRAVRPSRSVA